MAYLFNTSRYVTQGVRSILEPYQELMLWELIDGKLNSGTELDYLQCFDFLSKQGSGVCLQQIIHRQEQPEYSCIYYFPEILHPISNLTIWVIDSGEYVTMLLPSEY